MEQSAFDFIQNGYRSEHNTSLHQHLLSHYSGPEQQVYLIGKKVLVNFRGTTTMGDLGTDLMLLFGLHRFHPRFQRAKQLIHQLKKIYPSPEYTLIAMGHSLGGTLAEFSQAPYIFTYNKGVGFFSMFNTIPKNQVDFRVRGDLISFLTLFQRHHHHNLIQFWPNIFFSFHSSSQILIK